jgi:hypothetical protein
MNREESAQRDLQVYQHLLQLWRDENPIKTIKLQFLLVTNALLLGFLHLNGGLVADNRLLMLGAFVLNAIWTLSIGRTALFQKAWKIRLDELAAQYPHDPRFQLLNVRDAEQRAPAWLRLLGGVSSKYYLLGAPAGLAGAWLVAALLVHT